VEIKVLGDGCSHCSILYSNTLQAVRELNLDIPVTHESDILKILQYRVLSTPALIINEEVISAGEMLSVEKIKEIISGQVNK